MPARDRIHGPVRRALIKDGWSITEEPLLIEFQQELLPADLGAEQTPGAWKNEAIIGVENKSFPSNSLISNWHRDCS